MKRKRAKQLNKKVVSFTLPVDLIESIKKLADALLIVGAKEYGIEWILSFDSDFDEYLKRIS